MTLLTNAHESRSRLVVLGLDGLPLSLARRLAAAGACPNLGRLFTDGCARAVTAELPELSPVNWTSFATAAGPEDHGVFGFTELDPQRYAVRIADFSTVSMATVFDTLGRAGLSSRVVNLPGLYPARPIAGGSSICIAGFPGDDLFRAVHPPAFARPLADAGYVIEGRTELGLTDPPALLGELRTSLTGRTAALDLLWPDLDWDCFVFVLTETDRLFHFLFPAVEDPSTPLGPECARFLAEWDAALGELLDRFEALPGPKRLLALADHGFCALKTEVDLNAWLRENGFLDCVPGAAAHALDGSCIGPDSRAFAMDPGRILFHDDRYGRGRVMTADARTDLAAELRHALLGLTWNGEAVMEAVYDRDELYPGTVHAHAPDLVCRPRPGFDLKAKFDRQEVFGVYGRLGTHTPGDAFFYDSAGASPDVRRVRDVGALVLEHFDCKGDPCP